MYTATFRRQEVIWGREDFGVVRYKAQRGGGRELKADTGRERELNTAIGNNA